MAALFEAVAAVATGLAAAGTMGLAELAAASQSIGEEGASRSTTASLVTQPLIWMLRPRRPTRSHHAPHPPHEGSTPCS
jgi:hypothetical protein